MSLNYGRDFRTGTIVSMLHDITETIESNLSKQFYFYSLRCLDPLCTVSVFAQYAILRGFFHVAKTLFIQFYHSTI